MQKHIELVVLGSGPAGYTAAFRAADLGKKVILVERYDTLGGTCLNVGCIPSKYLLHYAKVKEEAEQATRIGMPFHIGTFDFDKIRNDENNKVQALAKGIRALARKRGIDVVQGEGRFIDDHTLEIQSVSDTTTLTFDNAIIAAGSSAIRLPFLPDDPRVMTSTKAVYIPDIPKTLMILGGGIIGLEMATVYQALGSKVTVVELGEQLIPGADADLVAPLQKRLSQHVTFLLKTKLVAVQAKKEGLYPTFEGENAQHAQPVYDRILCAVGRSPNGKGLGLEKAGVYVNEQGFVSVNQQLQTNISHIYAIGDIIGQPMLAHKALAEAKVAAEIIAKNVAYTFEPRCIPSVAYTSPELAWVGLTETEAKEKNISYKKAVGPWRASGRALTQNAGEGITKLLFDQKTHRLIGAGIVGAHADELIAMATHAIEMGSTAEDISGTIFAHPTLSETIALATEVFEGRATDLPPVK